MESPERLRHAATLGLQLANENRELREELERMRTLQHELIETRRELDEAHSQLKAQQHETEELRTSLQKRKAEVRKSASFIDELLTTGDDGSSNATTPRSAQHTPRGPPSRPSSVADLDPKRELEATKRELRAVQADLHEREREAEEARAQCEKLRGLLKRAKDEAQRAERSARALEEQLERRRDGEAAAATTPGRGAEEQARRAAALEARLAEREEEAERLRAEKDLLAADNQRLRRNQSDNKALIDSLRETIDRQRSLLAASKLHSAGRRPSLGDEFSTTPAPPGARRHAGQRRGPGAGAECTPARGHQSPGVPPRAAPHALDPRDAGPAPRRLRRLPPHRAPAAAALCAPPSPALSALSSASSASSSSEDEGEAGSAARRRPRPSAGGARLAAPAAAPEAAAPPTNGGAGADEFAAEVLELSRRALELHDEFYRTSLRVLNPLHGAACDPLGLVRLSNAAVDAALQRAAELLPAAWHPLLRAASEDPVSPRPPPCSPFYLPRTPSGLQRAQDAALAPSSCPCGLKNVVAAAAAAAAAADTPRRAAGAGARPHGQAASTSLAKDAYRHVLVHLLTENGQLRRRMNDYSEAIMRDAVAKAEEERSRPARPPGAAAPPAKAAPPKPWPLGLFSW
eukprot:tig00020723_g13495.t1